MADRKGDNIYGGAGSLLDRLGTGRSVVDTQPDVEELTLEEPPAKPARRRSRSGTTPQARRKPAAPKESVQEYAESAPKTRITVYMDDDLLARLDRQGIAIRSELGRKRDRSELIGEAIELWLESFT